MTVMPLLLAFLVPPMLSLAFAAICLRFYVRKWASPSVSTSSSPTLAFFHPFCHAGGGGERVLWVAIRACLAANPQAECIVYSGDYKATPDDILNQARNRFGISIDSTRVQFVFLRHRWLVEAATYPRLTLIGQSLGSVLLVCEAVIRHRPTVFIDTMGYAFTYPAVRFLVGCPVMAYTHYPTISTDMLKVVESNLQTFNNAGWVTRSPVLRRAKLWYYRLFASAYGWCGRHVTLAMANSTWTYNHLVHLWRIPQRLSILYPPCDTSAFERLPATARKPWIVSVAQYRPEKNHRLQVESFAQLLNDHPELLARHPDLQLVVIGGCRDAGDTQRANDLEQLARDRNVADRVRILRNVSLNELTHYLGSGMIGLHSMVDEHFGISVVEAMASGLVTVANDSAGPKEDIVVPVDGRATGYLASTVDEYAQAFAAILGMSQDERVVIVEAARKSVKRFSEEAFEREWLDKLQQLGAGL